MPTHKAFIKKLAPLFIVGMFFLHPPSVFAITYQPGETLDPSCLPTDPSCSVATSTVIDARINATSTIGTILSLPSLSLSATQLANFGTPFYTFFNGTTTDALSQGSINKYYSDTSVNSYLHASSTIPKTYTANTFTGANNFIGGNVGIGTATPARTLDVSGAGRFSSVLTLSNTPTCTGFSALQTNASGDIACGIISVAGISAGGGWVTNNIGSVVLATSTDRVGIGATTTPYATLSVISGFVSTTTLALVPAFSQTANIIDIYNPSGVLSSVYTAVGNLGLGTTSPSRTLSVNGSSDLGTNALAGNFTAASATASTFPYASTTALTVSGANGLTLASLNGPLQANAGVVSATSSIGVPYGGTGLTTAPSFGNLLVGNSEGGYTLMATSSLGLLTTNVAEGANLYFTNSRVASVIAGTTTDALAQGSVNKYYSTNLFAGSLSGTTTSALAEGANLYFTNNRVASVIAGTTTSALAEGSNLYFTNNRVASVLAGTSTTALLEGANLYFTNARADARINATSTIGTLTSAPALTSVGTGLTGLLKATAGALTTTFVNLASDITGILPVGNGGTGWANIAAGAIPYGNGSGALATTTAGTAGRVLAFLNGIPTWTATTTFSGGLSYSAGTVTLNTGNANTWSALQQFSNASSTLFSAYGPAYFGATATSSFSATGALTLSSALTVPNGGTGATSFGQGWLFSTGDGNALSASTSPTFNYITATSTTATSTFAGGINVTGGCIAKSGVCLTTTSGNSTVFKAKNADQAVTSNTTLTSDTDLTFSAASGDTWAVNYELYITNNSSAAPDLKLAILGASGWTCSFQMSGLEAGGTTFAQVVTTDCDDVPTAMVNSNIGTDAGKGITVHLLGTITASSAGSVTLQFAQNTSSANAVTIKAGSFLEAFKTAGSDVAEVYYGKEPLGPGTVVSIDSATPGGVIKSSGVDDKNLLGVVSTRPGLIIGDNTGVGGGVPTFVALSGRVPVMVSAEHGPIAVGDYLTSSSIPGVAMRADNNSIVIGQALSAFDGDTLGQVPMFVKNFERNGGAPLLGETSASSTSIADIQSETPHNPLTVLAEKIAGGIHFLTDFVAARVTAIRGYFDELFAKKVHTDELCLKKSDGSEVCLTGDELQAMVGASNSPAPPAPTSEPVIEPTPPQPESTTTAPEPAPVP